jgi:excinuclease ABC subunit C
MFDKEELTKFPTQPGVYLMRDADGSILYVGKAKNLRNRVRQYFRAGGDGRPQIPYLMAKVEQIDTIVVRSEKEALILENNLIKEHQPKYNIFLKDDKSYVSLMLTDHQFPKIELIRQPPKKGTLFGPYTSVYAAKQLLELIIRIFPLRRCTDQELARRTRPCLLHQIKRCIAPCVGNCSQSEYDDLVQQTTRFLQGKDDELLRSLYSKMEEASEALQFERANEILQTIRAVERTLEEQRVEQSHDGDRDVLGLHREGAEVSLAQLQFRGGKLIGTQHFEFSHVLQEDDSLLSSFLLQHYSEELPKEILLPCPLENLDLLTDLLSENRKRRAHLTTPQRGRKLELVTMANANAAAQFHRGRDMRAIREKTLIDLQETLHLMNYPRRIECFDNSSLSGTQPVSAMVAYTDGEKDKKRYRKYKVKTADDYAAMRESLTRRLTRGKKEDDLPDLLLLDGGKGQLNAALSVLEELDIVTVDTLGLAKEEGRHDRGLTAEKVYTPHAPKPIHLERNSPTLYFLQQVRDEAHRFALTFQKQQRSSRLLTSQLDALPGIGPKKKRALLTHFGSVKRILTATADELSQVKELTRTDIKTILNATN